MSACCTNFNRCNVNQVPDRPACASLLRYACRTGQQVPAPLTQNCLPYVTRCVGFFSPVIWEHQISLTKAGTSLRHLISPCQHTRIYKSFNIRLIAGAQHLTDRDETGTTLQSYRTWGLGDGFLRENCNIQVRCCIYPSLMQVCLQQLQVVQCSSVGCRFGALPSLVTEETALRAQYVFIVHAVRC